MNTLQLHGFDVIRCSPSAQLHSGTNTIDIIMIYFKDMKPLEKKRYTTTGVEFGFCV